jgi:hypothetical protein
VRPRWARAGRLASAGLLCALPLAGCAAEARHARPTDTGIPVPRGDGVQGEDTDPKCRETAYVAACGRAAGLGDIVSRPADDYQVERRTVTVEGNVVRLTGHYRSSDAAPNTLRGDYHRALELARWTVRSDTTRRMTATGSGDYAGWSLALTFDWNASVAPTAKTDIDVRVIASGPVNS